MTVVRKLLLSCELIRIDGRAQRATPIINKHTRAPAKNLPAHACTPNLRNECWNGFQPVDARISRGILREYIGRRDAAEYKLRALRGPRLIPKNWETYAYPNRVNRNYRPPGLMNPKLRNCPKFILQFDFAAHWLSSRTRRASNRDRTLVSRTKYVCGKI